MQGDGVSRSSGATIINPSQLGFPAELTSRWDSAQGYSWKRLVKQGTATTDPTMQLVGKNAITPDNDESLTEGTQGWMEPDPGRRGYFFLTFGGGDSGDGGSTGGCDWVDALTDEDCLKFSFVSGSGRCRCAETFTPLLLPYQSADDGGTWGTGDTFTICGVKYIPTFKREACNGPCLSIATVPEGSTPCCDPDDEGTADAVNCTMTVDGVDYTGTLLLTGGVWTGELAAAAGTAECYQRTGLGTTFTRLTPGVDQWNDGSGFREIRGPSMLGAGNWEYVDVGVCMSTWLASAWDGTGCKTFSSGGACTPNTVEICEVGCP